MDDVDARILAALLDDGRASLRDVAARVDVAVNTVARRVTDLEATGVVTGYVPRVNYAAVGYDVTAVHRLRTDPSATAAVAESIESRRGTVSVYETAGVWNVVAVVRYRDGDAVDDHALSIHETEGVRAVRTCRVDEAVVDCRQFVPATGE